MEITVDKAVLCRNSKWFDTFFKYSDENDLPELVCPLTSEFSLSSFYHAIAFMGSDEYYPIIYQVSLSDLINLSNYFISDYLVAFVINDLLNTKNCNIILNTLLRVYPFHNPFVSVVLIYIQSEVGIPVPNIVSMFSGSCFSKKLRKMVHDYNRKAERFWQQCVSAPVCPLCQSSVPKFSIFKNEVSTCNLLSCCHLIVHKSCYNDILRRVDSYCPNCFTYLMPKNWDPEEDTLHHHFSRVKARQALDPEHRPMPRPTLAAAVANI